MSSEDMSKTLPKYPKLTIVGMLIVGGWIIWTGINNYGSFEKHEAHSNRRRFLNQMIAEAMQKIYEIGGENAVLAVYLLIGGFFLYAAFRIFKNMVNQGAANN